MRAFLLSLLLITSLILHSACSIAQQVFFKHRTNVPITVNSQVLKNAWAGGINAPQMYRMHLNSDTVEDLVVFDKTLSNKLFAYLATFEGTGYTFKYTPEYEAFLPPVSNWFVVADYDNDGRKDILTMDGFGVALYRNLTVPGQTPSFVQRYSMLYYQPPIGPQINIAISADDYPSFVDVDFDGDLDILTFDFPFGGTINWFKNLRIENALPADSVLFTLADRCWGDFFELASCDSFFFNYQCPLKPAPDPNEQSIAKVQHAGSTSSFFDIDNDGDMDIFLGDIDCNNLNFLRNVGNAQHATVIPPPASFPTNSLPASLSTFPLAIFEDLDFDGKKDLMISPNVRTQQGDIIDFRFSTWLFKNIGQGNTNEFQFQKSNFLQEEMIDVGQMALVALEDIDQDGDLDMLVGSEGQLISNGIVRSKLQLFTNTGTAFNPAFTLSDADFLGLSTQNLSGIQPVFTDYNFDGKKDLVIISYSPGASTSQTKVYLNMATSGTESYVYNAANSFVLSHLNLFAGDALTFYDINGDSLMDVLVGRFNGRVLHFQNSGSNQFTQITNQFLGFDNSSPFFQNAAPYIVDINNDNQPDLLVASSNGKITVVDNINLNITLPNPARYEIQLFNPVSGISNSMNLGIKLSLGIGDLNGDFAKDIVVGMFTGGLQYLENTNGLPGGLPIGSTPKTEFSWQVYPNPSNGSLTLKSEVEGMAELFTLDGKQTASKLYVPKDVSVEWTTQAAPGVYLLRFTANNGQQVAHKRIIINP